MSNASKTNEYPTIADLFCLLDRWRHLPAYQFERRADILFALFLPEVLEKVLSKGNSKVEIKQPLIPELPIRTDNDNNYNSSNKIDYLALSKDKEHAFLIELKTDMESIDPKQICFLKRTAKKEISEIIRGILKICHKTEERAKYVHLLTDLSRLGLVEHKEGELGQLYKNAIPVDRCRENCPTACRPPCRWRGERIRQGTEFKKVLRNVVPAKISPEVSVVYIQPKPKDSDLIPCDWHRIYFDHFADHAKERDSIGRRFAESLRAWKEPAGLCPPQS